MKNRIKRFAETVLVGLVMVSFVGCGSSGGGKTSDPLALIGTWLLSVVEGEDVTSLGFTVILADKTYTYNEPGWCTEMGTYATSGDSMTITVTDVTIEPGAEGIEDCSEVGDVETFKFSVNATELTFTFVDEGTGETDSIVFEKVISDPTLLVGTWMLVEEEGVPVASDDTFVVTATTITTSGEEECNEVFSYTTSGNTMNLTITDAIPGPAGNPTICDAEIGEVITVTFYVSETELIVISIDEDTGEPFVSVYARIG